MLSYLSRWASVGAFVMSFTATISKPAPRSRAARNTLRPMRPNPLIATRALIRLPPNRNGKRPPVYPLGGRGGEDGSPQLVGDRQDRAASDGVSGLSRKGCQVTHKPCLPIIAGPRFSGNTHLGDILGFCKGNKSFHVTGDR